MVSPGELLPGAVALVVVFAPLPLLAYVGLRVADVRLAGRYPVGGVLSRLGWPC
jgi:hypothetical protein